MVSFPETYNDPLFFGGGGGGKGWGGEQRSFLI